MDIFRRTMDRIDTLALQAQSSLPMEQRSMTKTDGYPYLPLQPGQTRYFTMNASLDDSDEVICEMKCVRLDSIRDGASPVYIAISHAWGRTYGDGRHLTKHIFCDGMRLQVTINVHEALRRIRERASARGFKSVNLWVDAICINQRDVRERAHQVRHMAQIFSSAESVIIWLGDFDVTAHNCGYLQSLQVCQVDDYRHVHHASHSSPQWLSPNVPRNMEAALRWLTGRPWFERRWVIQEYMLSPKYQRFVQLGDLVLCANQLRHLLKQHGLLDFAGPFRLEPSIPLPLTLLQNMHNYGAAQCSESLDMAFSFFGLSTDYHQTEPDYHQTVDSMFMRIAQAAVLRRPTTVDRGVWLMAGIRRPLEEDLQVIATLACATVRRSIRWSSLPCWVPDWEVAPTYVSREHIHAVDKAVNPRREIYETGTIPGIGYLEAANASFGLLQPEVDSSGCLRLNGWLIPFCVPFSCRGKCVCCTLVRHLDDESLAHLTWSSNRGHRIFLPSAGEVAFVVRLHHVELRNAEVAQAFLCFTIYQRAHPDGAPLRVRFI